MLVVADTSPIRYLAVLGHVDLLPLIFGTIIIPGEVLAELSNDSTPIQVQQALSPPPEWLMVREPVAATKLPDLQPLDKGERAALALAVEMRADLVLVDDSAARRASRRLGLRVTGTLGVLVVAADRKLLDVRETLTRLKQSGFYIDDRILKSAFAEWLE